MTGVVVRLPRWVWWSALLCFVGIKYHRPIRNFLGGFRCALCGLAKSTAAELLGEKERDGYVHLDRPSGRRGVLTPSKDPC
jgi:hypothetical protein